MPGLASNDRLLSGDLLVAMRACFDIRDCIRLDIIVLGRLPAFKMPGLASNDRLLNGDLLVAEWTCFDLGDCI